MVGERRQEFEESKRLFVQQYGRQPNEEEEGILRLANGFTDLNAIIERDLIKRGAPDEVIYAFRKTGILISPENEGQISAQELRDWNSALEEYRRMYKK